MATGLTGEIISRLSGRGYHQFMHEEILEPLGMRDSYMLPPEEVWERIATVWAPNEPHTDYERYNSPYFRKLGIPWGCLYTTPEDLALFGQMFLTEGRSVGGRIISPATAREMTRDQLRGVPGGIASSSERWEEASWGLGWDVKGNKAPHSTGALTSPRTFSHGGSAGSLMWCDPVTDVICVLIANRTLESDWTTLCEPRQALFSNAVAAAVVD
ncbi:MAG TPA: serine hydrolase [Chloroflexota bacterium]|nr:serine hydrolase [Chloroflexota bacterium]